jgi:hypothetical protein
MESASSAEPGVKRKVRQRDELHPHLRGQRRAPGPTSTIGAPVEHLDLAAIIKVSPAVSGEIVLEKVLGGADPYVAAEELSRRRPSRQSRGFDAAAFHGKTAAMTARATKPFPACRIR